jgi:hypothetical protein
MAPLSVPPATVPGRRERRDGVNYHDRFQPVLDEVVKDLPGLHVVQQDDPPRPDWIN